MTETEQFICKIRQYCSKKGFSAAGFLAVRLFETGGTLSAWYYAALSQSVDYIDNGERLSAFGLLQWTPIGCEPILKHLGLGEAQNRANHIAGYRKIQKLNRLQQLDLLFKYFDYWDPITSKKGGDRGSVLYQYVLTLSPGAGANYKDGNGVTAAQLVEKKSFKAYVLQAEGMLAGKIPVPNDSPEPQVIRPDKIRAYQQKVGTTLVNPNSCAINSEIGSAPTTNNNATSNNTTSSNKTALEDKLPMRLNFNIPEYPRLAQLKPGDALVLPSSATYRDWLITSVSREFAQGINTLAITANRPLDPKPFIQTTALEGPSNYNDYYWLT
jgi:hypothetical protein